MERDAAHNLLIRVRDELDAARFALKQALALFGDVVQAAHAARVGGVSAGELRRCEANLEITYILRLFAEFEGVLRDYWAVGIARTTDPSMNALMDAIAVTVQAPTWPEE